MAGTWNARAGRALVRMSTKRTPPPAPADRNDRLPAAGPHDKPELTNPEATPGTGMLPDPKKPDDSDMQPSS
jgi:hypothetical protein